MSDTIQDDKFVELTYEVRDKKSGQVLTGIQYPLGYVHGRNDVLAPAVIKQLEGQSVGDVINVPIDCNELYGPRDESLVFTDHIDNVPKEYHEIGTAIVMESESGDVKKFIVTRMDDKTLTVDGNNPLCGRHVIFELRVLSIRDATDEEIEAGGPTDAGPDIDQALKIPV